LVLPARNRAARTGSRHGIAWLPLLRAQIMP